MFPLHFLTTVIPPKVDLRASLEGNLLGVRIQGSGVCTVADQAWRQGFFEVPIRRKVEEGLNGDPPLNDLPRPPIPPRKRAGTLPRPASCSQ